MIRLVHRNLAAWLVLAATAMLVTGCGNSSNTSSSSAALIAGPPITNAQALAYAHAVNLRTSDWPDSRAYSSEREIHQTHLDADVARCGGAFPLFEAGGIESPTLLRRSKPEVVVSIVHVVESAAIARQRIAADRSIAVRSCIARAYETSLNQPVRTERRITSHVTVTVPLTPPPGTGGSVGLDLLTTTTVTRAATSMVGTTTTTAHSSQDILVFASGPVELAVADVQPIPSLTPTERRLLLLLHSRAKAHKL
jgi:hypothetical protein